MDGALDIPNAKRVNENNPLIVFIVNNSLERSLNSTCWYAPVKFITQKNLQFDSIAKMSSARGSG